MVILNKLLVVVVDNVSEKENRLHHAESRELNLPLVYVCHVDI